MPASDAPRRMTGSRYFAEALAAYGTTHAFLVPSILTRATVEMADLGIERVVTHGEKAAAYMADGYARLSGRPGLCLAQHVGAANLAAGLRDASMAGSPVIAVTGGPELEGRYRHAYQQVEDFEMFAPVTKLNTEVDDVAQLPHVLRQLFRTATTGNPGPVHLRVLDRDGGLFDAERELTFVAEPQFGHVPPFRPLPQPAWIDAALELLASARRPVIVAGSGVMTSGARDELVRLAERLGLPVATSVRGKGAIPDDHPLSIGVAGLYSRACANRLVARSDLVLFVATHTGQAVTDGWRLPRPGTQVIQIDIDPAEIGRNYPGALGLLGDARETLALLAERCPDRAPDRAAWRAEVGREVAQWREDAAPRLASDAVPIRPERLCAELTRALPENAVVVVDTGHSAMWIANYLDVLSPEQRLLACAGSLGWAFPASLGAKCAAPDRPIVCFAGDGGLLYHLAELETAARHHLAVVVVVNDNRGHNQHKALFQRAFGGKGAEMWKFRESDLAMAAESLGCLGIRVEQPSDIAPALERALGARRPVVVDVVTDVEALAPLAWRL